jgi:hypothetical protein
MTDVNTSKLSPKLHEYNSTAICCQTRMVCVFILGLFNDTFKCSDYMAGLLVNNELERNF